MCYVLFAVLVLQMWKQVLIQNNEQTKNQVNISLNRFSRHICISNMGALNTELTLNSKNFLAFKEVDFCIEIWPLLKIWIYRLFPINKHNSICRVFSIIIFLLFEPSPTGESVEWESIKSIVS